MRILQVTPSYYPVIGGTEVLIENISLKLSEMGVATDILTFNLYKSRKPLSLMPLLKGRIEEINGLKVIKIPALTFLPIGLLFRVNFIPGKFLDRFRNYDVIHFHNDMDLSFPLFSCNVNKPKVFHCHCLHFTYNSYRRNPLAKRIFKKIATVYIVQANCFLKWLINLGIPETQIKVVPNAVDVKKFKPSEEIKSENIILFVGRIDPNKGLSVLLEALNYIKTKVQLIVIGPPGRPWYFKKCLGLINKINKNASHRVTYLGVCKQEELIRWYQKASILACPSLFELFGMVNLEALSCATPVVATKVGAIPEIIKNYENGILVPPNDPLKLAEGIQYLLDNKDEMRKFGKNGRAMVVKNFSCDVIAKKLLQIYSEICNT
ncbi:MAG: glycosyltransferase family 4 protein [Candidatus Aenigmatarchaeota archaeon]